MDTSKKRHHYYDRVRAVIDRVLEKRNEAESGIACTYLSEMGVPEGMETDKPVPKQRRARRAIRSTRKTSESRSDRLPRVDMSWKTAGRSFPRISSRVGLDYQAVDLPVAGSYKEMKYEGDDHNDSIL